MRTPPTDVRIITTKTQMIIKDIHIQKFRGFNDESLTLGQNITVVAGQNGSQKSTLLGILSQTFTLSKDHPMSKAQPLSGGNYKSLFNEKFKISKEFDKAGEHEWTLNLDSPEQEPFIAESIHRDKKDGTIRFWKKGKRGAGDGYLQYPVIFLSLKRLSPLGEDKKISISHEVSLSPDEIKFYQKWHNRILIVPSSGDTKVDYLASNDKQTLGISSDFYDWQSNSAGQDNIGKILLSILSFKRLKEQFVKVYKGGILVIDELDATLYPASQVKLFEALRTFSSKFGIQIIFTTHSYNLIRVAHKVQSSSQTSDQVKVALLRKYDRNIKILEGLESDQIELHLNLEVPKPPERNKIRVFTEDPETEIFFKTILKRRSQPLNVFSAYLGCGNLLQLASKDIPSFDKNECLIVLDGDVELDRKDLKKANSLEQVLILPGKDSPEKILAKFLLKTSDKSDLWEQISKGYSKQFAFSEISYDEICSCRVKSKKWFNDQKTHWGRGASRIINPWIKENQEEVDNFLELFDKKLQELIS